MSNVFVVPFRDRGRDNFRAENLAHVMDYLATLNLGSVHVVSDGRSGDAQFCRHEAYNRGTELADDIITYYESDVIVPREQLAAGIKLAATNTGLVIPFREYNRLNPTHSAQVRAGRPPSDCAAEYVMPDGRSVGAVNILSLHSITAVGRWDTVPDGNGYDDRMMWRAFEVCCGPTRYIDGPVWHLYHRPGWWGFPKSGLTSEDRAATARNKARYALYEAARTPEQIRALTAGGG